MAIEEPKFTVSLHQGACEIRDYEAAIAAEVTVTGEHKRAANRGFRLLAGYIFGGNTRHQSIAMTAPVAQQRTGKTIAMMAPVTHTLSDGAWIVRFTMPSGSSLETLPEPNDPKVKLRTVAPARFAVIRFRQRGKRESQDRRVGRLREDTPLANHRARFARPIQSAMDSLVHAAERGDDPAEGMIVRPNFTR